MIGQLVKAFSKISNLENNLSMLKVSSSSTVVYGLPSGLLCFNSCVRQRVGFYFDVSDAISASIFRGVAVNCNLINSHFPEDGRSQCVRNVKPKTKPSDEHKN